MKNPETYSVQFVGVTLEPFRLKGADALDVHGLPSLEKVELEELQSQYDDDTHHIHISEANNLFPGPAPQQPPRQGPPLVEIPKHGELISARLFFRFRSPAQSGHIEIRPHDNTIGFDTPCPPALMADWLFHHGFARRLQE